MRRILATASVAAVGIGLVAATTGGAQSQAPGQGRTFVTYEKAEGDATFRFVDAKPFTRFTNGEPRRISMGDGFVVRSVTYSDAATTKQVSRFRVHCIATNDSRRFDRVIFKCDGVESYADGTIAFTSVFEPAKNPGSTGAITGGTGAYEGASGQVISEDPAEGPTKNTFHLITG